MFNFLIFDVVDVVDVVDVTKHNNIALHIHEIGN